MKLAIIGASYGQLPLCLKAKDMGIETICFAWEDGAICRDYVDKFYPISIFEKEIILEVCRDEKVDGVVSNASDILAEIVAFLADELGLIGNKIQNILLIKNKQYVRSLTSDIENLESIRYNKYDGEFPQFYPCVIKPITGASKKGVFFVDSKDSFNQAILYAKEVSDDILVEEYIIGREISVETISYRGEHRVVQFTDKENSGAPHFVELAHHQPAELSEVIKVKISKVVVDILNRIGFENGASHIEMKIDNNGNLYLIEVNPRGGGDEISAQLVQLSTGYDYLRAMIEVALGTFQFSNINTKHYSGICFLCNQTKERVDFFKNATGKPWLVRKDIKNYNLTEATGNYDRNGYVIYQSEHKIEYYEK